MVRDAAGRDIPGIREVTLATGQPETDSGADADYVRLLLATGAVVVAVDSAETVIGVGATKPCAQGSLLSDLFVHPTQHGHGVGSQLLQALWPDAPAGPGRFTFSSQHRNALPLYARAGLSPCWPLLYLTGAPAGLPAGPMVARPVSPFVAASAEADLAGADRAGDYAYWGAMPDATGLVVHNGDRLVAAGAATPAELLHLACPCDEDASGALLAALSSLGASLGATRVTACLPGPHPGFVALVAAGFRIDEYDIAMTTPDVRLPVSWAYSPGLT